MAQEPAPAAPIWPVFERDEIDAVVRVLESGRVNYWTGTEGREFERELAAYVGTRHAIAMANGTVTLEAALEALDIGPGDEVIIPPRTFMATATSVMVRGATPVFADIDSVSGNLAPDAVERKITPRTKAVIPVHVGGWPCEMDALSAFGLPTIEDCAQAHGATFRGASVGSIGTIGSWSFCQDKIMTLGGEGGAVTTSERDLWDRMWSYKDHGKTWQAVYEKDHPPGFRWLCERLGTNLRLTEMQSAIGRIQLRKLDDWVATRAAHGTFLNRRFAENSALTVPLPPEHVRHAYYRWHAYLNLDALASDWTRERVCAEVSEAGVWCQLGSCSEIYREHVFDGTGYRPEHPLENARAIGETSVALRTDPSLSEPQVAEAADVLESVLQRARR